MAREWHKATGRSARLAALPLLALAASAHAQVPGSVEDYRLPPAPAAPPPNAAGPVDTDHPVAAPTRPAPTPSPSPAIVLPAPAARPASPRATATPAAPRAERQTRTPAPEATAQPPAAAAPLPVPSAPASLAPATEAPAIPAATAPAPEPSTAAPPARAESANPWPWLAGGAIVLCLLGFVLWRRRSTAGEASAYDEPGLAEPERPPQAEDPGLVVPPPAQAPSPRPPLADPAPPAATPLPKRAAEPEPPRQIAMELEARHLSRALVNATLSYRLTLTNRGAAPLGPLRVAGDITSAHASLSPQDQLAPTGEALATIHQVAALAPGESIVLSGELRLPLASILPINSGGARVFVPLARFRVETAEGTAVSGVFVIGQASDAPGGALRPFPLDRGPGVDRGLGQRELVMPA